MLLWEARRGFIPPRHTPIANVHPQGATTFTETAGAKHNLCASGDLRKVYAVGKNASIPVMRPPLTNPKRVRGSRLAPPLEIRFGLISSQSGSLPNVIRCGLAEIDRSINSSGNFQSAAIRICIFHSYNSKNNSPQGGHQPCLIRYSPDSV